MSQNFSAPRSAPKPASVITTSASDRPSRVATALLQPCAMLAKGPPWTRAGEPSRVCTRFGASASRSSAAMAPSAWRSRAVTMRPPSRAWPTMIRPSRACRSARSEARQRMAITSEATVMSKPSSRGTPWPGPPRPSTRWRSARSFMSTARRHATRRGSRPSALPQWRWLSSIAESRLWALVTACRSPVKWRLMLSIGATCARPPPVAPPFKPKQGPSEGSRRQIIVRVPRAFSASPRPIVVVVLPSPAAVGVMPVTSTSLPCGGFARCSATKSSEIFALCAP